MRLRIGRSLGIFSKESDMIKYIKVTMIFEPDNGSTLDIDALKEAVQHSVKYFAPEPKVKHIEVLEGEIDDE